MKTSKVTDTIFLIFTVIVVQLIVIPLAVPKLFGHIWSWEGFIRSVPSVSLKTWVAFYCILVLTSFTLLLIIHIPVSLSLQLTVGEKTFSCFLWKRDGKIRWVYLCIAAVIGCALFSHNIPLTARWFEKYDLIAHAGGISPSGYGTNSLEAFETNYQQGHRVFEGDLYMTAEGVLVMTHDWGTWCQQTGVENTGKPITYEEFMTTKLCGTETPMDLALLMNLMIEHKDMYFVTDFKNCNEKDEVVSGFQQITQAAKAAGHMEILDRFIIQCHHNEFKHWVEEIYPFENWLYTIYSSSWEEHQSQNLISYCEQENIPVVTMPYDWYESHRDELNELAQPLDIRIFVHTVNDLNYANSLIASGVSGLYTDSILPDQIIW